MASDDEGAQYFTDIEESPTSVADIWLGLKLVGINCGSRAENCSVRKGLLAWDRRLLRIFGQGPCQFRIFGSVLTPVEDDDDPDWSPG